jgi:hypothetical protein
VWRLVVVGLALASVTVAPAAPAVAQVWESPVALSDTVATTENVQLVRGSDGRVLALWSFRLASGITGVEAASRRPDGVWGPRRETPLAAWQTVIDGHAAVRSARLDATATTTTFTATPGGDAILDDLALARSAPTALAWHAVGALDTPGFGFVATAPAGGSFGGAQQVTGAPGATGLRLADTPRGVLVAWNLRTRLTSTVMAAALR